MSDSHPDVTNSLLSLQLNALDSRHLDEIHFDVRLTAFQDATRYIKEMQTLDLDYIGTIIHNCFYTFEVRRYSNLQMYRSDLVFKLIAYPPSFTSVLCRLVTCHWETTPTCVCLQ